MKSTNRVSVVMPVFNGESFLTDSIESILNQTYQDFEFIMVDDGSTDRSLAIISSYEQRDSRIRVLANEENKGISYSTNLGISHAQSPFIALMDQDDICFPQRFEKQVEFLSLHPDISVLGANSIVINKDGSTRNRKTIVTSPGLIRWGLLFTNQIQNPTVMMRSDIFSDASIKYEEYAPSQDYHFWLSICDKFQITNLAEPLIYRRLHDQNATDRIEQGETPRRITIRKEYIERTMNFKINDHTVASLLNASLVQDNAEAIVLCKIILQWLKNNWLSNLAPEDRHYIKSKTLQMLNNIWYFRKRSPTLVPYLIQSWLWGI